MLVIVHSAQIAKRSAHRNLEEAYPSVRSSFDSVSTKRKYCWNLRGYLCLYIVSFLRKFIEGCVNFVVKSMHHYPKRLSDWDRRS